MKELFELFGARKPYLGFLVLALFFVTSICSLAQEVEDSTPFPIGLSLVDKAQFPDDETDIMGLRLCLLYGRHANVAGLDIGVFGCGVDGCLFGLQASGILNNVGSANGALQFAGIANNCLEDFYGIQLAGIVNKTDGDVYGGQLTCFNIAKDVHGTQIGVFNKANYVLGIQIGVINLVNDMDGIQLGVVNIIKNGPLPYMIVMNANF